MAKKDELAEIKQRMEEIKKERDSLLAKKNPLAEDTDEINEEPVEEASEETIDEEPISKEPEEAVKFQPIFLSRQDCDRMIYEMYIIITQQLKGK